MSIIKERLRLSSKDLMTALGSGQRNGARPNHAIFLSVISFFDSIARQHFVREGDKNFLMIVYNYQLLCILEIDTRAKVRQTV